MKYPIGIQSFDRIIEEGKLDDFRMSLTAFLASIPYTKRIRSAARRTSEKESVTSITRSTSFCALSVCIRSIRKKCRVAVG